MLTMISSSIGLRPLGLVAVLFTSALELAQGRLLPRDWLPSQINQTLCWWELPRAALLRDTLYLDGGYQGYLPGFANGTFGPPSRPEDRKPLYMINFTQAFDTTHNASTYLRTLEKTVGATNNLAPVYLDGTLVANDYEFYLYGGLLRDTDSLLPPPGNAVLGYERFQFGPRRETWEPGFYGGQLPDGVTRYITAGAAVNVPAENLSFYFSGMRHPNWAEIRTDGRTRYNVTATADTLIAVDLSTMRQERWTNVSLPASVPGRAGAELVWVPLAERGLLIAIGGVINPEWAFTTPWPALRTESQNRSPGFMRNVSIYDIRNQQWYQQETSGDRPPQLTQFCSVLAPAKDGSSFHIYIYGGYDGLEDSSAPSDDVHVLSVPSFIWTKVSTGTSRHGRRGHRCARPYPDQMMVVGGQTQQGNEFTCLEGGVVQIFNLNTLQWQKAYDPKVWSEYKVPGVITAKIGGNADGGATTVEPSRWDNDTLASLMRFRYTKTIPSYYPYPSVSATASPPPGSTLVPSPAARSSGTPSWIAPVLGVVLGLLAFGVLVAALLLWRRRRRIKRHGSSSDGSTTGTSRGIIPWLQGTRLARADTVTTATNGHSSISGGTTALGSTGELSTKEAAMAPQETAGTEIHELPGTLVSLFPHLVTSDPLLHLRHDPPLITPPDPDTSGASELPTMREIGFTPTHIMHPRPRPVHHTSNPSSSSSLSAGIPRPESPTTDYVPGQQRPGHRRHLSSLSSSGLPSPASTITPPGSGDDTRERGNPMEEMELVSPVSQGGCDHRGRT
ncbi:MAG: hypothetical protein M1823_000057 [Watsoniomyces obsoletus]|nr:MAG: hypothetical protein M1823_000057 [Watsoniomyces obsoletus]